MQYKHFLLMKKLKNTESAQLCKLCHVAVAVHYRGCPGGQGGRGLCRVRQGRHGQRQGEEARLAS